ncbi:MAG TPA: CUAEP/CCAEP-tail radical SAM protein, partial [Vicinamibacterales bacterium]
VVAFYLPMHTATRLALPVIDRVRALNPNARLIAYGLYAPLNRALLESHGVTTILGGEFEAELVDAARGDAARLKPRPTTEINASIARLAFRVPDRSGLPPLSKYATLQVGDERRTAGYTEASRGCKHHCRHCPIVPVYNGQFRVVSPDVVLADAAAQVAAGARHITFGDPDFFNGPKHARTIVERFARELPGVTYDVTIKVEHLLKHADLLPLLRDTGCAFVTCAVESLDDEVLLKLRKGHTRADFERVVALFREIGLTIAPTFVAFTPWTTHASFRDMLATIDRLDLVENVPPVQYAIRLLVPEGSRMLELPEMRALARSFDPASLTYPWSHPDPSIDRLQRDIATAVGVKLTSSRREMFRRVWALAHDGAAAPLPRDGAMPRATIPYLNEPWYC